MTVKDILSRIEYTVIIDGVEYTDRDITFSTWTENMMRQSEKASGYKPEKMFDPVARENFQKYFAMAYFAGMIPAKVIETRINEVGEDGCYVFTVETVGSLDPENDSTDSTDSTDSQPAAPAKFAGMHELIPVNGQKSFHGKAVVETYTDGSAVLFSYNTPIIKRLLHGELVRLWDGWTATTGKHISAFCGLKKAAFMALPLEAPEKKPGPDMSTAESYRAMMGRRYAG